jgi:hypothetical protein
MDIGHHRAYASDVVASILDEQQAQLRAERAELRAERAALRAAGERLHLLECFVAGLSGRLSAVSEGCHGLVVDVDYAALARVLAAASAGIPSRAVLDELCEAAGRAMTWREPRG